MVAYLFGQYGALFEVVENPKSREAFQDNILTTVESGKHDISPDGVLHHRLCALTGADSCCTIMYIHDYQAERLASGLGFLDKMRRAESTEAREKLVDSGLSPLHSFVHNFSRQEPKTYVHQTEEWALRFRGQVLHSFSDQEGPNAEWVWANRNKLEM